jgi:hypothetical protein
MRLSKQVLFAGVAAVVLIAAGGAAFASHGKAGLWDIQTTMNMGGMEMPDMSKLPPEAQAQMRKMGVQMKGNTISSQHCMTADDVAQDKLPSVQHNKNCSMEHTTASGGAVSADMVCTGEDMQGTGHLSVAYDGDSHYTGKMTMTGNAHGHPLNVTYSFEGKWVSADCGGVNH